jgi:hypothetical protein
MPALHAAHPRRMDNTEEYQCVYHEKMLKIIAARPYLWATHQWNMFDFAADARNQGGEPGMNHKGLVTFDRQLKKDAFFLYKAYWSSEPFVHICGKRFAKRTGKRLKIKVYSNAAEVTLYQNGRRAGTQTAAGVFEFTVPAENTNDICAVAGTCRDEARFLRVPRLPKEYKLRNAGAKKSWEK